MGSIFIHRATFAIMLLLASHATLPAQAEPESASVVIESQDGLQRHVVRTGERLDYRTQGGSMQRKGLVESVQADSVTIAGKSVAYREMDILVKPRGKRRPIGLGLLVGGLVALPISVLFWIVSLLANLDNPTQGERALSALMTVLTLILLPLVVIVGFVLLITGAKRFDLRKGWKVGKG